MPAPETVETRTEFGSSTETNETSSVGRQPEGLVLLVDSDPSSVEFMARALSQAGLKVVVADRIGGPEGAAAQLRTQAGI